MNPHSRFRRGLESRLDEVGRLPISLKAGLAAACTQRQAEIFRVYMLRTGSLDASGFARLLSAIWRKIRQQEVLGAKEHAEW